MARQVIMLAVEGDTTAAAAAMMVLLMGSFSIPLIAHIIWRIPHLIMIRTFLKSHGRTNY
ncbi:hypothetical protein E2C01_081441 [Portunus trituberculatus]|uniref:Uncharacterized protein n=1 Tax=Portunus trituberculatus TaxID=210409 RepID=A0A5B7IYU5_PORTR|nr:hypothetical protein [Portunus trituberculatus]